MPDLAIIIVNYNTKDLTGECLKSIYEFKIKKSFCVAVVDNGSSDGSLGYLKKIFPQVKFIASPKNLGFSAGNNLGIKSLNAKYYLLLNSDTRLYQGSLDNFLTFAENNNFMVASCKLLNADCSLQPNGGDLPTILPILSWLTGWDDIMAFTSVSYHQKKEKYFLKKEGIGWVSGTAMLVNKQVFDKIGLLDDKIFMYGEDVEFCMRASKNGYKIGWTDQLQIIHLGGASSITPKINQWQGEFKGLLYVYQKYYGLLAVIFLKILFYIFISARVLAFSLIGKFEYSKTYAKILTGF